MITEVTTNDYKTAYKQLDGAVNECHENCENVFISRETNLIAEL